MTDTNRKKLLGFAAGFLGGVVITGLIVGLLMATGVLSSISPVIFFAVIAITFISISGLIFYFYFSKDGRSTPAP